MTVARFSRFQNEQEGANHLIECIRETIGIDISYDAQAGIFVVPRGEFVVSADGGSTTSFFGKARIMLEELAGAEGLTCEQMVKQLINDTYERVIVMGQRNKRQLTNSLDDDA